MIRITFILTTRGNIAKTASLIRLLNVNKSFEISVYIGGALEKEQSNSKFRGFEDIFALAQRLPDYISFESGLEDLTSSFADSLLAGKSVFSSCQTDYFFSIADRYEMLGFSVAALLLNVKIIHLEGGETSGSIDDRIRHSISRLAHIHFVASVDARDVLVSSGEPIETIYVVGSPSFDLIPQAGPREVLLREVAKEFEITDIVSEPFLLIGFHPNAYQETDHSLDVAELAAAVNNLAMPFIWVLPNNEVTALKTEKFLKSHFESSDIPRLFVSALGVIDYCVLMSGARCFVGNSSSGIREASYLGIPCVNVGTRQKGRTRPGNLVDAPLKAVEIVNAVEDISANCFESDHTYGKGDSASIMCDALLRLRNLRIDKNFQFHV